MSLLPNLFTERLILRSLSVADASSLQKIASSRQIADTTISIFDPSLNDSY